MMTRGYGFWAKQLGRKWYWRGGPKRLRVKNIEPKRPGGKCLWGEKLPVKGTNMKRGETSIKPFRQWLTKQCF